jgi:hypothetical protein
MATQLFATIEEARSGRDQLLNAFGDTDAFKEGAN